MDENEIHAKIPNLDDLTHAELVTELNELSVGLTRLSALDGVAFTVASFHIRKRLEQVRRSLDAFDKVTVRHLKAMGTHTCQYGVS